jgi:uncharacterized repeat protein (TIGR01451 family)
MNIRKQILFTLLSVLAVTTVFAQPEITVKGNDYSIADGETDHPDSANQSFHVQEVNVGTKTNTFWIFNEGTSDLTVGNFDIRSSIGAANQYDAHYIITPPSLLVIPAGDSISFDVTYAPTIRGNHGNTTVGAGRCIVQFTTDDPDEAIYDFTVSGTAIGGTPFDCGSGKMILANATTTRLWDVNYHEMPLTLTLAPNFTAGLWVNGVGIDATDNILYGIRSSNNTRNQLWASGADGRLEFVGYVTGLVTNGANAFEAGDMAADGFLYCVRSGLENTLWKINIRDLTVTTITLNETIFINDIAYSTPDGLFYAVSAVGGTTVGLISIDPTSGTVTNLGNNGAGAYEGTYASSNGDVFGMDTDGTLWNYDKTDGSQQQMTPDPGYTPSRYDGASCGLIDFSTDVELTKTDHRNSYEQSSFQSYKVVVKNHGPAGLYEAQVQDTVPAGIPDGNMTWSATTHGTAVSRFSSGTGDLNDTVDLALNDSIVYTVKILVPAAYTGYLVNTGNITLLDYYSESNSTNNTVTDTDSINTTATEQCNNGFDDDGDGFVDCFDGDCAGVAVCTNSLTGGVIPECPDTPNIALFSMQEQYRSATNLGYGYATPVVGDLDGDGIPEIVTVSNITSRIYVANGQTGATITSIIYQQTYHNFAGGVSIADIDNDGTAEVFIVTGNATAGADNNNARQYISCYDYDGGNLTFRYRTSFGQNNRSEYDGQKYAVVQFVDFDQDGTTELFIGNHVMKASTGAIIASPTTANRYLWPRGRYHSAVGEDDYMSAAYDILPDAFCATCDGVEIIAGNTVYAVDLSDPTNTQNGITVAAQMTPTSTYHDGLTSLADWDGDGEMDVIVVGRNGGAGAYVYIWNPRTQTIMQGPVDIQAGNAKASRASVADYDGDGANELAIVSQNRLHIFEQNLTIKWSAIVVDGSSNTSATAFDFEGDGNMEVVYRDEQRLRILDGVTGAEKVSLPCGSGTRVEMPIIADVDADGEAEIICSCDNYGGSNKTVVFKSDQTPWMPSRKVWNSLHYAPTFINEDLTIPAHRQNKALIPKLDIYAAQAPITDPSGNLIFPALPDFVVSIDSSTVIDCTDDSTAVYVTICNDDAPALIYDYPLSFYDGDPGAGGNLLGTRQVTVLNTTFTKDSCYQFTFNTSNQPTDLYVIVNDDGTGNAGYPTTSIQECDSTNNQTNVSVGCVLDGEITKTDGRSNFIPGGTVIYTIIAKSNGPIVLGGIVSDPLPTGISTGDVTWTAVIHGGATTTAVGTMNGALQDTVDIPGGDSVVYTVNVLVPANFVGDLVNIATITVVGDTITNNNTAIDTDTVDCTFAISGTVNSSTAAWQQIGTVVSGFTYDIISSAGGKTFTATNGPENGEVVNSVIYNTGTGNHVSLTRNRYNSGNNWFSTIAIYDNTPWGWTGLSGTAPENAPVLGFMAFIDQNGNGTYDSGTEEYIRDINSLLVSPTTTGELYMAFYDDGNYNDNNGIMTIEASVSPSTIDLGSDSTICEGDSVLLDASNSSALSWLWSTGETSQTVQEKSAGEYSVVVTTTGGCMARDTVNVATNDITVSLGNDTSLCIDSTIVLNSTNPTSNSWVWSDGNLTQLDTVNTAGTYSVIVTDSIGCEGLDTIVISNIPKFNLGFGNDTSICIGETIDFTFVKPNGSTQLWNTGSTAQTITVDSAASYSVLVVDSNGCPNHDTIVLSLSPLPIIALGNDTTICPDSLITITSQTGTIWTWNTGDNTQSISTDSASVYEVEVTDANGCVNFDTIVVSVASASNINLGNDTSICAGDTLILDAGNGASWTWNTLETGQSISVTAAGTYIVDVNYASGCVFSDTVVVTIDALPILSLGNDTAICAQNSIILDAGTAMAWLWSPSGNSQTLSVDTAGTYDVQITDINGCIDRDTIIITTDTLPVISLGNDTTFCDGDSLILDAGTANSWTWSPVGNTQFITVKASDTFIVSVVDGNLCENNDTIVVTVNPIPIVNLGNDTSICSANQFTLDAQNVGATYLWSTGETDPTISTVGADTYEVIVTDGVNCIAYDTIVIDTFITPIPNLNTNDTSICEGDTITLSVDLGFDIYSWTNHSSTSNTAEVYQMNTHEITVTTSDGCEGMESVNITVNPLPVIGLDDSTNYCAFGQNLIISVFEFGATYLWSNGLGTQHIQITSEGTYWVDVTDANNCFNSDTILITSDSLIIDLGPDQTICENDSAVLDAGSYPFEIWNITDTASTYTATISETVSVIAIDADGCFGTDTVVVNQILSPTIDMAQADSSICDLTGDETTVSVVDPQGLNVNWNTGETGQILTVTQMGTYIATITDGSNCSATDSAFVDGSCDTIPFTMPNIFTPNDDEINDDFVPVEDPISLKDYFTSLEFMVYNRWGGAVFLSTDLLPLWDGVNLETGKPCSDGVYFWLIEYRDIYGNVERINGFVHLVR